MYRRNESAGTAKVADTTDGTDIRRHPHVGG